MTSTLEMLPPDPELSPERLDGCEDFGGRYNVVPSVICSMCCLFGIIYCFFGYRCFKAVMFLTGLMFGSVVIFMLCYKERVLDTQLSMEASVGIGLGIGTLCGLVTMLVRSVGLFMVGLLLGLLVAVATLVGMEELSDSPPRSVWVPLGVLLGLGMLFAVLALQWQRLFTTFSTAMFGAAVITVAVDYFVELFALVLYMYERLKAAPGKPVCWVTWVVLGVWPALTLLGVMVQWKVTAEGYSHTKEGLSPAAYCGPPQPQKIERDHLPTQVRETPNILPTRVLGLTRTSDTRNHPAHNAASMGYRWWHHPRGTRSAGWPTWTWTERAFETYIETPPASLYGIAGMAPSPAATASLPTPTQTPPYAESHLTNRTTNDDLLTQKKEEEQSYRQQGDAPRSSGRRRETTADY
ncbi:transmembrane protein 198-B-like [Notothenia coriiceps]|uniref:Transmembrane protein 198 n=1 Tax=Notothenia coriiceps TaxID=8208 RepID=A0A6I9NLP9_9TELE|nr:PREDICTED: transmembrane protein 198-B-like [Notothenia coriiceps]